MKWITLLFIFCFFKTSTGRMEGSFSKELHNYLMLKVHIIDPLKKKFGDIYITSIFRTWPKGSQHTKWEAFDVDQHGIRGKNKPIWQYVLDSLPVDQAIRYDGYEHLHFSYRHENNRNQVLIYRNNNCIKSYYK